VRFFHFVVGVVQKHPVRVDEIGPLSSGVERAPPPLVHKRVRPSIWEMLLSMTVRRGGLPELDSKIDFKNELDLFPLHGRNTHPFFCDNEGLPRWERGPSLSLFFGFALLAPFFSFRRIARENLSPFFHHERGPFPPFPLEVR